MRILHTADWHLGQLFYGHERLYEQRRFLDWLRDLVVSRRIDALLIAGDIFDVASPSIRAQRLLYDFIVQLHAAAPHVTIVMIAGNHDSGPRIDLPAPLMQSLRTYAHGRLHWHLSEGARQPDLEALCVPLPDRQGKVRAWCLAMPFLRPSEICQHPLEYCEKVSALHQALCKIGATRRAKGEALIAMAHLHLHGAAVSADSERPIVIGGEEALSASLFPAEIDYVALGHLHRAQQVGAPHIRYAGSPYPLDFSECHYHHQVIELALPSGQRPPAIHVHEVPVSVAMLTVGPVTLEALPQALEALSHSTEITSTETASLETSYDHRDQWPWLRVNITLEAPRPDLRQRVEALLADRPLRLASLTVTSARPSEDSADVSAVPPLDEVGPAGLFQHHWQQQYGTPPDDRVLRDFAWLMQQVHDGEEE